MRPRLSSFERAWADAALCTFFPAPPRSVLVHGIDEMGPGQFIDDILMETPLEPSVGLRLALWIIALAPLFTIRRFATIAGLEHDDRVRVLERLLASPIYAVRQLVLGFKAMGALLYSQSKRLRTQMNTPKAPVVRLRLKGEAHADAAQ
jgi:hypothetical protein